MITKMTTIDPVSLPYNGKLGILVYDKDTQANVVIFVINGIKHGKDGNSGSDCTEKQPSGREGG